MAPSGVTVQFTPAEIERISQSIEKSHEQAESLRDQPRRPRDAESLVKEATGASLMADMANGSDGDSLPVLEVGRGYPPCTKSLSQLSPIALKDVLIHHHHTEHKLAIQRISPVTTLQARSWCAVQDTNDPADAERLEIVLHKYRHGGEVLDSSKNFIIKNPFLTVNEEGQFTLRIDHPSDLIVLPDGYGDNILRFVEPAAMDQGQLVQSLKVYQSGGDAAISTKDWPLAYEQFHRGTLLVPYIQQVSTETLRLINDMHRSYAIVAHELHHYDDAAKSALASLSGDSDVTARAFDSQMYSIAASAAYENRDFDTAKHYILETLRLAPDNVEAVAFRNKYEARIKQRDTGKFDWPKIKKKAPKNTTAIDIADFTRQTDVKVSPGKGRGLFAACDIQEKGIIMVEKALCTSWAPEKALKAMTYDARDREIRYVPLGLTRGVVQELLHNPSKRAKALDLYGDYDSPVSADAQTDEGPVVDVFRLHDIVSRNAFAMSGRFRDPEGRERTVTGLWVRAEYANHSCRPNATLDFVGDTMVVRAMRAIKAGEEILHGYVSPTLAYDYRQRNLQLTWGFQCSCELCEIQKNEHPDVAKKRAKLVKEGEEFLAGHHWADASSLVTLRAKRIVNGIETSFDPEKYKGMNVMPEVVPLLRDWIAKATPRK